jgi:hypothetical protein
MLPQIGAACIQAAINSINQDKTENIPLITSQLVVRDSVAAPQHT